MPKEILSERHYATIKLYMLQRNFGILAGVVGAFAFYIPLVHLGPNAKPSDTGIF
jgi:hypothetical protein